eukprot:scaffold29378_cov21-Tisochrysis_lutea.AAC.1
MVGDAPWLPQLHPSAATEINLQNKGAKAIRQVGLEPRSLSSLNTVLQMLDYRRRCKHTKMLRALAQSLPVPQMPVPWHPAAPAGQHAPETLPPPPFASAPQSGFQAPSGYQCVYVCVCMCACAR